MHPDHDHDIAQLEHGGHHGGHRAAGTSTSSLELDRDIVLELGLLDTLAAIKAHHDDKAMPPAATRMTLSATPGGHAKGNPIEWTGFRARTIVVYNNNPFAVWIGQGSGAGGSAATAIATVPAFTVAVLPIEEETYSIGCAAASVAAADATLTVIRFVQALEPASYPLALVGSVATGSADDASAPVKVGGVYRNPDNLALSNGQRAELAVDNHGHLKVVLWARDSTNEVAVLVPADAISNANAGVAGTSLTHRFNGSSWDRDRTPTVFKKIAGVAVAAGTPVSVWTPAAGKKFRLMGWALSLSVAGAVILDDNGSEIIRTPAMAAGVGLVSPPMGNGLLSAAANNPLKIDVTAGGNVHGYVFGTEE